VLHLHDPLAPRGLRLPIDFFFRALANDQLEQSIGVILSGMGSDGTLGLRAIKEKAGVVFVQEPASAKFDAMPRSAIDAGLADVVVPVEELPDKISDYFLRVPIITKPGRLNEYTAKSALEKVVVLLRGKTGHDFSLYKKTTVYRRVERRMGLHQIGKIANYVSFLQENPQEVELLFKELLISVTSFFRDPEAWGQLKAEVLPALLAGNTPNRALRVWIPACATGEEAYSMAILFKETVEELKPAPAITLQIFATDLDQQAVEKARRRVPDQHRRRRFGGASGPLLRQGGARLSGGKNHSRDDHLCPAEHHHGSALYQTRLGELSQPAHLSHAGIAEETSSALTLQPEPGRLSIFGERGDCR
jgi:hypothetical protein